MSKVLLISNDISLQNIISSNLILKNYQIVNFSASNDSLDIMSQVCVVNPFILILDDDFTNPITPHLLSSIRKVSPKLNTIFVTSDSSLEIGRKIHSIGVKFYMIKPIARQKLNEFLKSIEKENQKQFIIQ